MIEAIEGLDPCKKKWSLEIIVPSKLENKKYPK